MAFVAVNEGGYEYIFNVKPYRTTANTWDVAQPFYSIRIPKGSIKKLIGRELSWSDSSVKI